MIENILIQAMAAAIFAKTLVDISRMVISSARGNILPVLAIVYGLIASTLLLLYSLETITRQTIAGSILVGILAGGSAIGVTVLHEKAKEETK